MIGLASEVYDIIGDMVFSQANRLNNLNDAGSRRCTRTATLDGGCTVYDTGYSDSDNTVTVREENASQEAIDFAKYIVKSYGSIVVTMKDGAFLGVPSSWKVNDNSLDINILITEKISE